MRFSQSPLRIGVHRYKINQMNEFEVAHHREQREKDSKYPRLPLVLLNVSATDMSKTLKNLTGLHHSQIAGFKGRVFNYELAKSKV